MSMLGDNYYGNINLFNNNVSTIKHGKPRIDPLSASRELYSDTPDSTPHNAQLR